MYITISIEAEGNMYRLSIDDRQYASAAVSILKERGLIDEKVMPKLYKSALIGEWIRSDMTFADQGIVSGDLLFAKA